MRINGGYFPAICPVCFVFLFQSQCAASGSIAATFRQFAGYVLNLVNTAKVKRENQKRNGINR